MTERKEIAYALRALGSTYAEIGAQLGVSRQRAQMMVKQAENVAGFTNANATENPSKLGGLMGAPTTPGEDGKPLSFEGTRLAYDINQAGGWTFTRLVKVLEKLRGGYDPQEYYALAEEMLERDANLRSLLDIRVAQTAHQPLIADVSTSSLLREKKRTQQGIEMLMAAGFRDVMPQILAARHYSVCILEAEWVSTATERTISKLHWRDPKSFVFDRHDPRKLWLKPATPGGDLVEAPAGRFIVVFANGKPGTPVRGGLAVPAAWEYVKKSITEFDWTRFLNRYGKPSPAINVPEGRELHVKERAELRRMASQLGGDTAAILEGGITISYSKDGTVAGSSEAFESKVRYHDEQKAKLYLGGSLANGTGNTGSGGSQALGNVHGNLRYDLQKADAQLPTAAANEALYYWAIFNGGPDAFIPKAKMELDEPVDKVAARENAKAAHDMGLPLSISKTAEQLGVFLAETEEDTLAPAGAAQQAPGAAALSAALGAPRPCPAHTPALFAAEGPKRDAIDDLADSMLSEYEVVTPTIDAMLAEAVLGAGSVEAAAAALLEVVKGGDVDALKTLFTAMRTAARAGGRLGGEA